MKVEPGNPAASVELSARDLRPEEPESASSAMEGGDDEEQPEQKAEEVAAEFVDEAAAFLRQIPPDWDKASEHGRANLVVDSTKTEVDVQDKDSFCVCCHLPYPKEEHFFSLCSDTWELGALGPGYPLYFEFMKWVGYLMLALTVIYFVPCAFLMYDAFKDLQEKLDKDDSVIALFSFGAFVQYTDTDDVKFSFLDYDRRNGYAQWVGILQTLCVVFSLIFLIVMRYKILQTALKLDEDAFTPSDFCLMGMDMTFDDCSPEAIKERVTQVFADKFAINDVVYVNPAYDIKDFYKWSAEFNELQKHKLIVQQYLEKQKFNESKYRDMCRDPESCPDDFPRRKTGLCGSQVIDLDEIENQMDEVKKQIENQENLHKEDGGNSEEQKQNFTGIVFIVLERPKDCLKVLESRGSRLWNNFKRWFCCCCVEDDSDLWYFERAPEPSDIFWENVNVGTCQRIANGIKSYISTFIMMCVCLLFISLIKRWQEEEIKKAKADTTKKSFQDQVTVQIMSGLSSAAVVVINALLKFVVRRFTLGEEHSTQTKMNVSVALKLTVARFLNSSLILVIVNNESNRWFKGGDLVYDAFILVCLLSVQAPL